MRTILRELLIQSPWLLAVWLTLAAFSPAQGQHCQVHVDGDGSLGSGTLIDTDEDQGLVITCGHMVRDSKQGVWVSFPNDPARYNARICAEDQANDLCALMIALPNEKPIKVARDPASGTLRACGFGGHQGFKCYGGPIVGQTSAQGATHPSLMMQGAARPGDSGGGIFNEQDELVGVLWGTDGAATYLTAGEPLHALLTQCCPGGTCYGGGGYRVITQPVQPAQPPVVNQPASYTDPKWVEWRAKIEARIAAIELTPGPAGPPGAPGLMGPQGPAGAIGASPVYVPPNPAQQAAAILPHLPPFYFSVKDERGFSQPRQPVRLGQELELNPESFQVSGAGAPQ